MSRPLLEVRDLVVHYGQVKAIDGVSLHVPEGAVVALIGPNGAGKTTILRSIMGLVRPTSGEIWLGEHNTTRLPTHAIVGQGLSLVPEGRRIFAKMTVLDNLRMGAYLNSRHDEFEARLARVFALFPRLEERRQQRAGTLSGGEQQMLAIGRSMMSGARLLLLDEPSLGLSPILVKEIGEAIASLNHQGTSVLLVEQNARMALKLAQYGYVLERGRVVLSGSAEHLTENEQVRTAYLGL